MPHLVCVSGLWGSGKTYVINNLLSQYPDLVNALDIKKLRVGRLRGEKAYPLPEFSVEDLIVYYQYIYPVWENVLGKVSDRNPDGIVLIEMSPYIMNCFRMAFEKIYFLDTCKSKIVDQLSAREGFSKAYSRRIIEVQETTFSKASKEFWDNVIRVRDGNHLELNLRNLIDRIYMGGTQEFTRKDQA